MDRAFETIVDSEGHITIPSDMRDRHGLSNGARVKVEERGEEVVITSAQNGLHQPQKRRSMSDMAGFLGPNSKAREILMEERRKDREKEDRPFGI